MRVYVDSSALLKRSIQETESEALERQLAEYCASGVSLVSSALAWIEVSRALLRVGPLLDRGGADSESGAGDDVVAEAIEDALAGVAECPIDDSVIAIARRLQPWLLRSLDAIHLATALLVEVDAVIAYDRRLLQACREHGLVTVVPTAVDGTVS